MARHSAQRLLALLAVGACPAFTLAKVLNGPRPDLLLPDPDPAALASRVPHGEVVQWRSDVANTGYVNVTAPEKIEQAWRNRGFNKGTHTAAKSSPLLIGEALLQPGDSGVLWKVDLHGTVIWAAAQTGYSEWGFHSTPCVVGNLVIIGAYDGSLYAFDWDDGRLVWKRRLGQSIGSSPTCTKDMVYSTVEFARPKVSGGMCAVKLPTGVVKWCNYEMTDHSHSSPGLDLKAGVAVAGSNNYRLYSFDLVTGKTRARYDTGGEIKGPILIWKGLAIFGSWDKRIHAVDTATLQPQWSVVMQGRGMSGASVDPETDTVYVGSHDGNLRSISLDGRLMWQFDTKLHSPNGTHIVSSPVVTRNLVIFGCGDGKVYAITKAGEHKWSFTKGRTGQITSSVAVTDKHVAFASRTYQNSCKSPTCQVGTGSMHLLVKKDVPQEEL